MTLLFYLVKGCCMKKLSMLSLLVLLVLTSSFAKPKIKILGGASFDFGEIYKGEKVERKVTVKNIGNQMLVINKVQASCGCTAALLSDKNVKPGKTTSLSITFDSKSFSGEVHKNVLVYSNDPRDSSVEIKFTAKIIQVLEATPPYFYFMPGRLDSTMTSSVILKNLSNEPVDILSVTCAEPLARFELRKNKLAPGEATQLFLSYTPSKIGSVYKDVVIKTSHPKQPELTMKLVCNVRKPK